MKKQPKSQPLNQAQQEPFNKSQNDRLSQAPDESIEQVRDTSLREDPNLMHGQKAEQVFDADRGYSDNPSLKDQGFEEDRGFQDQPQMGMRDQDLDQDRTLASGHRMSQSPDQRLNQGVGYGQGTEEPLQGQSAIDKPDQTFHEQPLMEGDNFVAQDSNDCINEILRGEISAQEAYDQVFEAIKDDPEVTRLDQLRADHSHAVEYWKDQAHAEMSYPEHSSGVWGTAVEAFVGASKLLGQKTALAALKKGEEHGLDNYRKMLDRDDLSDVQKNEIRNTFIPCQQEHITTLNALIKMQ